MSDFLCVCQLSSRFTRQCHASTCHIVCGYMSYMHWDGAYSLQSESSGSGLCTSLHLEVSGTPGRRDRLPYLRSNSKQSCRRPIQVKNWILTWHCEMRNAWHHDIMTLQIFRSKSWLPHLALIFALVKSPTLEFLWISQLFSYFSRHFQSSQNIDCLWLSLLQLRRPFRSWVLPHSEGTQPSRSKELMETAYQCMHCQCILGVSRRFCSLAWVALTSHEVSKNVKDKIHERIKQLEDETRNQSMEWYGYIS